MHQGDEPARAGAIEAGDFGNVGAADKGAAAGAGKDRQPQFGIGRDRAHLLDDLFHQRAVEAVELGPVVDRQMHDMAALGQRLAPHQKATAPAHRSLPDSLPNAACVSGRSRWRFLGE